MEATEKVLRPRLLGDKSNVLGEPLDKNDDSIRENESSFIGGKYYVLRFDDTWYPAEVNKKKIK